MRGCRSSSAPSAGPINRSRSDRPRSAREIRGVEPGSIAIRQVRVAAGRQLNQADIDHRRRVAVLGHEARRELLGPGGRVGDRVRIGGRAFTVVGVLERVGTQFNRDGEEIDDQLWVPLTTHHTLWPHPQIDAIDVSTILVRQMDPDRLDETKVELRSLLARRMRVSPTDEEAIAIWSPVELMRSIPVDQQNGVMFVLAATTLIIGGIGVLNMMLDAVRERRREIGLRLAVGARRRDIVLQFFAETFTIVAFGGLLGVALGVGGCLALAALHVPDLVPVPVLTPGVVALALGVMGGVGLTAGVIPAWRASQIDPALTLRVD